MSNNNDKNYELKSDAVEKLLKAEAGEVPEFSQEELKKYRTKSRINLSEPVKVLLLKAWFAGAVCYFILWGLGMYIYSLIDMLFILGVVLGMVTDLMTNNVIRFIEKTPGENDKWLMFPKKVVLPLPQQLCAVALVDMTMEEVLGPIGVDELQKALKALVGVA